jgi:hypothetical protein
MSQSTDTNPFVKPDSGVDADLSIISTILDLDELMSADVRLAERTVTIYTRPDIEARIDALEAELGELLGPNGELPSEMDASLGDADQARAYELADEIEIARKEYAASGRQIRVRQLPSDDWTAFRARHKKALDAGRPYPDDMWSELVSLSAVEPTLSKEQVGKLRTVLGAPVLHMLSGACFSLNTEAGVSVPKSRLSSLVRKQREPEKS